MPKKSASTAKAIENSAYLLECWDFRADPISSTQKVAEYSFIHNGPAFQKKKGY